MTATSQPAPAPAFSRHLSEVADRAQQGDVPGAAQWLKAKLSPPELMPLHAALQAALDGSLLVYEGDYQETLVKLVPAIAVLEASPLAARVDWVYSTMAFALGMLGDPVRGLEWVARALSMAQGSRWPAGRRRALSTQGTLLAMVDDYPSAWQALSESLTLARDEGKPRAIVVALGNMAYCCLGEALKPDADEARRIELAQRALPYAIEAEAQAVAHGIDALMGFSQTNHGLALLLLGQSEAAEALLMSAVERTASHLPMQADALLALAMVRRRKRDFSAAWQSLQHAEAAAKASGVQLTTGRILDEAVTLALTEGDREVALTYSQQSTSFWRELHASRLKLLARTAALFSELEQSRRETLALRQESQAWADAALHDPLTGLFNRRGLEVRHQQLGLAPFGLALIDVDHFKRVNDTLGHGKGDEVLVALAGVLSVHIRHDDIVARVGGEEFVLLMPGASAAVMARSGERVRAALQAHNWAQIHPELAVTASIGWTLAVPNSGLEAPLAQADAALYEAKAKGRNCVVAYGRN